MTNETNIKKQKLTVKELITVGIFSAIIFICIAIFCYVTGMHIGMTVGYLVGSAVADLVAWIGCYKSIKINILSYIVFCLGGTGSYIAYFINPQVWVSRMLEKGTPQEYLNTMAATANRWILITMLAGTVLVALFSGFVGSKLLKKQFEKAGITA